MGIGLTEFLAQPDVRKKFDRVARNPFNEVDSPLVVQSREHSSPVLVGLAVDTLARYSIAGAVSRIHVQEPLTPSVSLRADGSEQNNSDENVDEFPGLRKLIDEGIITPGAIREAFLGAVSRQDWGNSQSYQRIPENSATYREIAECFALFQSTFYNHVTEADRAVLGPTFDTHSYIMEGASDLQLDGLLVEIKTTVDPEVKDEYWRQLLGCYLLNDIAIGIAQMSDSWDEDEPPYPINGIGIYFARHGVLKSATPESIFGSKEDYEQFRAWFVERSIQDNKDAGRNYDDIYSHFVDGYGVGKQAGISHFITDKDELNEDPSGQQSLDDFV